MRVNLSSNFSKFSKWLAREVTVTVLIQTEWTKKKMSSLPSWTFFHQESWIITSPFFLSRHGCSSHPPLPALPSKYKQNITNKWVQLSIFFSFFFFLQRKMWVEFKYSSICCWGTITMPWERTNYSTWQLIKKWFHNTKKHLK